MANAGTQQTARNYDAQIQDSEMPLSAVINLTDLGAIVSLSDGRCTALWQFAIAEPIESVAMRWAERRGASIITLENHLRPQ